MKILLIILLTTIINGLQAQFSFNNIPFYNTPELNPAFTGAKKKKFGAIKDHFYSTDFYYNTKLG